MAVKFSLHRAQRNQSKWKCISLVNSLFRRVSCASSILRDVWQVWTHNCSATPSTVMAWSSTTNQNHRIWRQHLPLFGADRNHWTIRIIFMVRKFVFWCLAGLCWVVSNLRFFLSFSQLSSIDVVRCAIVAVHVWHCPRNIVAAGVSQHLNVKFTINAANTMKRKTIGWIDLKRVQIRRFSPSSR